MNAFAIHEFTKDTFNILNYKGITKQFHEKGYVVARDIISKNAVINLRQGIEGKIDACAKQLGCFKEDYLKSVSRWVDPSPVTSCVSPCIVNKLSQAAQMVINKPVYQQKMNVICKNAYCTGTIPYHQDISYSPQSPYEFSLWVALDDISQDAGPLEVIPGSHLLPLKPAVDFWSPDYKQDISLKHRAEKLVLKAGDAIFFDSRLWHGSDENTGLSSRYALVVRWSSEGWKFTQPIPPIEPSFFGLWTSGKVTEDILAMGLKILFDMSEPDFIKLLDIWLQFIQERSLPFPCDTLSVLESFKKLRILHLAHTFHNGGDAIGTVYKDIWEKFLSPLKKCVSEIEKKRNL